jgi:hypothetical protein
MDGDFLYIACVFLGFISGWSSHMIACWISNKTNDGVSSSDFLMLHSDSENVDYIL